MCYTYLELENMIHHFLFRFTTLLVYDLHVANGLVEVSKRIAVQIELVTKRSAKVNLVASFLVKCVDVNISRSTISLRFRVRQPRWTSSFRARVMDAGAAFTKRAVSMKMMQSEIGRPKCTWLSINWTLYLQLSVISTTLRINVPRSGHYPGKTRLGAVCLDIYETGIKKIKKPGHL
jgi:hypothetical protein